jgi:signal transduction histidine kinase
MHESANPAKLSMSVTAGIVGASELAWGSYSCHFYASVEDLVDVLLPFFAAGVRNGEACLWLTNEPLSATAARERLRTVIADLDERQRRGQIEIVDLEEWFHRTGPIDATDAWIKRAQLAVENGYRGLRLSSNVGEHVRSDPPIGTAFDGKPIVGLFSYALESVSAADVLDVACRYQFVLMQRRDGGESDNAPDRVAVARLQRRSDAELKAEQSLREADRRKTEFLGMLGHELRNPLASILTASQLMTLRGGDQQFPKELEIIQRQVSHITAMVDELLDMSRIISGRIELVCEPLEIDDAVQRGIEIAAPLVAKRAHRLHVDCASPLKVNGDIARLGQVVANLLSNAARYTEPGGDITVTAERSADRVSLTIADTGRGIDAKRLPGIFEPFGKGRGSGQRDAGLGLGLCIVRSLVELHRGTVDVTSTVGKGTKFVVSLPALG